MDAASAELVERFERQTADLGRLIAGLTEDQLGLPYDAEGTMTVGQAVEHLAMAGELVSGWLAGVLEQPVPIAPAGASTGERIAASTVAIVGLVRASDDGALLRPAPEQLGWETGGATILQVLGNLGDRQLHALQNLQEKAV